MCRASGDGTGRRHLWIVSLFLTLTETVPRVAVTQTVERCAGCAHRCVLGFPLSVAAGFFDRSCRAVAKGILLTGANTAIRTWALCRCTARRRSSPDRAVHVPSTFLGLNYRRSETLISSRPAVQGCQNRWQSSTTAPWNSPRRVDQRVSRVRGPDRSASEIAACMHGCAESTDRRRRIVLPTMARCRWSAVHDLSQYSCTGTCEPLPVFDSAVRCAAFDAMEHDHITSGRICHGLARRERRFAAFPEPCLRTRHVELRDVQSRRPPGPARDGSNEPEHACVACRRCSGQP